MPSTSLEPCRRSSRRSATKIVDATAKPKFETVKHTIFADEHGNYPRTGRRGAPQVFPRKLYEILLGVDNEAVIKWTKSGTSFVITDMKTFTQSILLTYFRHQKYSSFQRQLNLYGFRKVAKGPDTGAYAHEYFLRDEADLLVYVRRLPQGLGNNGVKLLEKPPPEAFAATAATKSATHGNRKITIKMGPYSSNSGPKQTSTLDGEDAEGTVDSEETCEVSSDDGSFTGFFDILRRESNSPITRTLSHAGFSGELPPPPLRRPALSAENSSGSTSSISSMDQVEEYAEATGIWQEDFGSDIFFNDHERCGLNSRGQEGENIIVRHQPLPDECIVPLESISGESKRSSGDDRVNYLLASVNKLALDKQHVQYTQNHAENQKELLLQVPVAIASPAVTVATAIAPTPRKEDKPLNLKVSALSDGTPSMDRRPSILVPPLHIPRLGRAGSSIQSLDLDPLDIFGLNCGEGTPSGASVSFSFFGDFENMGLEPLSPTSPLFKRSTLSAGSRLSSVNWNVPELVEYEGRILPVDTPQFDPAALNSIFMKSPRVPQYPSPSEIPVPPQPVEMER